jgi:hypothetical protein
VSDRLEKLFAAVLAHARSNPAFARELEAALEVEADRPPEPPKRKAALLDPFKIYEQGWESMLRQRLGKLGEEQCRDVIHQYQLDPKDQSKRKKSAEDLREWIVKAILEREKDL